MVYKSSHGSTILGRPHSLAFTMIKQHAILQLSMILRRPIDWNILALGWSEFLSPGLLLKTFKYDITPKREILPFVSHKNS
ncbi:hypothetical protein PROFUN_03795 [Planoprotostelium fungivorum]|uniref:Uncharacterized protein n=1 Tax=Planoprotostelium fungivorum TaxID=1890364 RepID=A0A2P6NI53_9EUKA|nr:hypothetical protein PROFUN_03795 [Planoprotostelium fungivorum]